MLPKHRVARLTWRSRIQHLRLMDQPLQKGFVVFWRCNGAETSKTAGSHRYPAALVSCEKHGDRRAQMRLVSYEKHDFLVQFRKLAKNVSRVA